jgi:hypothetical protein
VRPRGKKSVRGRRGLNRVGLNGRFSGRALAPGTYQIVIVAKRGKMHRQVGRISVQVVPPGSRVRRAGPAPVFQCTPPAAQTGIPGAGLFLSPAGQSPNAGSRLQSDTTPPPKTPGRSGVLDAPPFHISTGSSGVDVLLALLLYGSLGLSGAVLIVYAVRVFKATSSP